MSMESKNLTELEVSLLSGIQVDVSHFGEDRKEKSIINYFHLDISQLHECFGWIEDVGRKDESREPSIFVRWIDIQNPEGLAENESCLLWATTFIKIYVMFNYVDVGKELDPDYKELMIRSIASDRLQNFLDPEGEGLNLNYDHPEFLAIGLMLLSCVNFKYCPSVVWWKIRGLFLNQKLLDERSPSLNAKIRHNLADEEFISVLSTHKDLMSLFVCEKVEIYLYYYDVIMAQGCLNKIEDINGLVAGTQGVMGRRTKYQSTALPQLALSLQRSTEAEVLHPQESLNTLPPNYPPENCILDDDTRLDKIAFEETTESAFDVNSLSQIDYIYILAKLLYVKKSQPKDGMYNEELEAFLSVLTDKPLVWGVKMTALYLRSITERENRRTVERSQKQLETLAKELKNSRNRQEVRYHFIYSCSPTSCFDIESAQADILLSLGCTKEALSLYQKYNVWEKSIECFQKLGLRHKAEEVIREELEKSESVKLWVLLGDVTDNPQNYEKAWELSNQKSGRCQRQWGFFFFRKFQYEEAALHFGISLELNSLEYSVWSAYGFSLMKCKRWSECARAYMHCVNLNDEDFEAWNNLGAAYKELKEYNRALNAMMNALRCNYEVRQIWENVVTVGLLIPAIDEVLTAYNRAMDLNPNKSVDVEALSVITNCIVNDTKDNNDKGCRTYKKRALELFGRITAREAGNGSVWGMYAELLLIKDPCLPISEDVYYRSLQCGEKCMRLYMQKPAWSNKEDEATKIVNTLKSFVAYVKRFCDLFPESTSRGEWKLKAKDFILRIESTLQRSMKDLLQIPSTYDELLATVSAQNTVVQKLILRK